MEDLTSERSRNFHRKPRETARVKVLSDSGTVGNPNRKQRQEAPELNLPVSSPPIGANKTLSIRGLEGFELPCAPLGSAGLVGETNAGTRHL